MTRKYHTFIGAGGRISVSFDCPANSNVARMVEVDYFLHTIVHADGAVWDGETQKFVVHDHTCKVGDFDDWLIYPTVTLAAENAGLVVPQDLWYTWPLETVSVLEEMARCSAEDREALEWQACQDEMYDDMEDMPF